MLNCVKWARQHTNMLFCPLIKSGEYNMKKEGFWFLIAAVWLIIFISLGAIIAGSRGKENNKQTDKNQDSESQVALDKNALKDSEEEMKNLNPEGMTLETRFLTPDGYTRVEAEAGSLAEFLRSYELKEDGSPVLLYDGRKKGNQNAHAAVFRLPIEEEDLQQCADSVMRVYAEYFYYTGQTEKIAFHFTNGFLAKYEKWREGNRIKIDGNDAYWVKTNSYDDSYETFRSYLRMVFAYAGTQSMVDESEEISLSEIEVGDVFLKGGSPGHVVMVVDVCQKGDGKAFLLAQGHMPAQEFHVLKNPEHKEDPWYYEEEIAYPFHTLEYTFEEGSLRRLTYFREGQR